jgi:hypothetical protein
MKVLKIVTTAAWAKVSKSSTAALLAGNVSGLIMYRFR